MGYIFTLWYAIALVLLAYTVASPHVSKTVFQRSIIETIPEHDPIAAPIRASVESIPLKSIHDEGNERLPLRDAVEKRLISPKGQENSYILLKESEDISDYENYGSVKQYYGAASYMNNSTQNDERLQLGNANLQEMPLPMSGPVTSHLVVCYMQSWAAYRAPPLAFTVGLVPPSCTHLHYAFANIHPYTYAVISSNDDYDIFKGGYRIATGLKSRIHGLKVMISIGGEGSDRLFSEMVQDPIKRSTFIDSAVTFVQDNDFDGLDLHWAYPGEKDEKEKDLLTALLHELREKLSPYGFLLSTVLPPFRYQIEDGYDLSAVSGATDYSILQAWDMTHANLDEPPLRAVQHSALHRDPGANSRDQRYDNIEFMVKFILRHGMNADKLVLGIPMFGRSYSLSPSSPSAPGAVISGWGEEGSYTQTKGMLAYFEICMANREEKGASGTDEAGNAYLAFDNQWVTFDNPNTVFEKMKFVISKGLAGAAAWSIDMDDFRGLCGPPFPLLSAISTTLNGQATAADQSSQKIGACDSGKAFLASDEDSCAHFYFCTGGINYRIICEDSRLYDPSTGFCSHQFVAKCKPGQSLRISVEDAARFLSHAYDIDFEWNDPGITDIISSRDPERFVAKWDVKKNGIEGSPCAADEYHSAPADCEGYLKCESGHWRKYRCAPGLHWATSANRCDWPNFAKCIETANSGDSTTTTTLAPRTSRPPPRPTTSTTTTTTTMQRPTTRSITAAAQTDSIEDDSKDGTPCIGEQYNAVAGDCNAYLHCDGSIWRLQHCAPGLHWSSTQKHCDWPENAKYEVGSPSKSPLPQTSTTVTRKPTTTRRSTTTTTTTTTTKRPLSTIKKPVTDPAQVLAKDCTTGTYHPHPKCEKFYVCVNGMLITQSCAPGLVWRPDHSQCDFPSASSCSDKRQTVPTSAIDANHAQPTLMQIQEEPPKYCESGAYAQLTTDCTRYLHCLFGKFEEFACSAGLHWNQEKQTCDWPKNAKCKRKSSSTTTTIRSTTSEPILEYDIEITGQSNHEEYHHHENTYPKPEKPIASPSHGTLPIISSKPALLNSPYKLICYYTNWSWYRPGIGKYSPEDIDPTLCTHIIYGFAVLDDDGLISCDDSWSAYENRFYERVVEFKKYGIKVSLAIGGWNDSAGDKYSKLVNNPSARARFVKHVVKFLEKYKFDGLDLDWEYPKCWQADCSKGPDSDKEAFTDFVLELSAALKPKGMLLSAAVSPSKEIIDAGYEVRILARYLDWISVITYMHYIHTYDYHGQWDKKTRHVAPLYYHPDDDNTYYNTNYTIHYWMKKGAPANKLVMGMPMYGQTFTLDKDASYSKDAASLHTPAAAGGEAGEWTRAIGFLSYYEICDRIRYRGWTVVTDPYGRMGPYAYKGNQWVSFDDVDMIKKKTNFVKSLGLAGSMVWALDLDDFRNRCGQGKHPLINAIKNNLVDPSINEDTLLSDPIVEPVNEIHFDQDDIQVIPPKTTTQRSPYRSIAQRPSYRPTTQHTPTTQWSTAQSQRTTYRKTTLMPTYQTPPRRPTYRLITQKPTPWNEVMHTTKKPVTTTVSTTLEERYKVICYYTSWAWYRPGPGKFTPSDIDPSLCTHIVYAFAVLDTKHLVIKPLDIWLDVENKFYEKVVAMKKKGVKVVLGLGGWDDSASNKYSRMVNSASARRKFIIHVVDFLEQFEFDGLDLDWKYPRCWQANCEKGSKSDRQGFASLVKELRAAFTLRGLLLSAAVSASKQVIDAAYDVPTLSGNLDWISLMTYDYHGQWVKKTGHVAPMYESVYDNDSTLNTNFTVSYWINKGASPEKLILGVPFYGQSFSLVENAGTGLGVESYAGGEAGDETKARGFLSFYEICERVKVYDWSVTRDPGGRMGPYAGFEDQWVSFDDDFMVRHKAEYVRAMGLGGGMAWALDLDDFSGKYCGCGKSPLLATMNYVLRDLDQPSRCTLEDMQAPDTPNLPDVLDEPDVSGTPDILEISEPDVDIIEMKPQPETQPDDVHMHPIPEAEPDTDLEENNSPGLEGTSCTGNVFIGDSLDCSKYYLCLNGNWVDLKYPEPLHWAKNHCVWPEKARCYTKTALRLAGIMKLSKVAIEDRPIVGCYFTNWAYYRPGRGSYGPEQLEEPFTLCTHIIYAWAYLDGKTFKIVPGNSELDIENDFYGRLTQLRQTGIKVIIGVGGLTDSDDSKWNLMISSAENRRTFVNSVLKFAQRWQFDGVQIAWQYPACKQSPCLSLTVNMTERDNFADLLIELSKTLRPHDLELSAMVAAQPEIAAVAYKPHILTTELYWVSIAANDYYASSTEKTSLLSPLNSNTDENSYSLNATLSYWSSVIPQQMVLGVPAYARSYTLRSSSNNIIGAPVSGPGEPGPYTKIPGFLSYQDIIEKLASNDWKEYSTALGTFGVYGDQWASYMSLNEASDIGIAIQQSGGRGAALWALDLDSRSKCSLLAALRRGLLDLEMEQCSAA